MMWSDDVAAVFALTQKGGDFHGTGTQTETDTDST